MADYKGCTNNIDTYPAFLSLDSQTNEKILIRWMHILLQFAHFINPMKDTAVRL